MRRMLIVAVPVLVVIFLVVGMMGAATAATRHQDSPTPAQLTADWQQVTGDGFGNANALEISALASFNGYLYAGNDNNVDTTQILRSTDGITWTTVSDPGFGIPHDTAPHAILAMTVFDGRIYVGTGRSQNAGQIWRSINGLNWSPVIIAGFGNPDTIDITAFAVYNGQIFAGATNRINGAQIWRSFNGDSNSWSQMASAQTSTEAAAVTGFAEFDGTLYAAVEAAEQPVQIWYSFGGDWMTAVSDGFGDSNTTFAGGMAVFGGYLYVGAGNTATGAQLWRTNDGETWQQVNDPGFGTPNNQLVESLTVLGTQLYATVKNSVTGVEVWQSTNGITWTQINTDGFGDKNNVLTNTGNAATVYLGQLFVGTRNTTGAEVWRYTPNERYALDLSTASNISGEVPGKTITYTAAVTNSGNVTDSYKFSVVGNVWPTLLSSTQLTLTPGARGIVTVSVAIPADAVGGAVDVATLTATSQAVPDLKAGLVFTTTAIDTRRKTYLPSLFKAEIPARLFYLPSLSTASD